MGIRLRLVVVGACKHCRDKIQNAYFGWLSIGVGRFVENQHCHCECIVRRTSDIRMSEADSNQASTKTKTTTTLTYRS